MQKEVLFGKTISELQQTLKGSILPGFAAKQIAGWMYQKNVSSIDEMSDISIKNRDWLKERFDLGISPPLNVQTSADGTKKYLFQVDNKGFVESAFMPETDRATLCVSSQVGCKMGCVFCMTGKQGFQAHLTAGEILNQIRGLPERDQLTNIVYMGMGEPLDNITEVLKSIEIMTSGYGYAWSSKRITVSSIGIIAGLNDFLNQSKCHLAISLHSPFDEERQRLMPIQNSNPIQKVLAIIREFDFGLQRRVSFEYIMFKGVNDTPHHVKELARILNGIRCRINLIRFHPVPEVPFEGSDEKTVKAFQEALNEKGIVTTIRASRGLDILAACGMLSTKEMVQKK